MPPWGHSGTVPHPLHCQKARDCRAALFSFALMPVNVGSMSLTRCLAQIDKRTSSMSLIQMSQSVESTTPIQACVFIALWLIQRSFLSWHPHTACWWMTL